MSLFNTLNTLAKSIGDVTNDAIEGNNINSRITKKRAEITDVLAEIGEFCYEEYQDGAQFNDVILDLLKKVDTLKEDIENLEDQRNGVNQRSQRQGVKCNSCGSDNSEGNKFCRECGGSLIPEPVEMKTCSNCGATMTNESVFCGECGTKIE